MLIEEGAEEPVPVNVRLSWTFVLAAVPEYAFKLMKTARARTPLS